MKTLQFFVLILSLNLAAQQSYDYSKSPNSFIFDPYQDTSDGLYIPVKKAYEMWRTGMHMGGAVISAGNTTADVLWEDTHGLIKSSSNYSLEIMGVGEDAKIKVPINKAKEGNAVIAFKVNNEIFWSWHVWVTDDPTNGSSYNSLPGYLKREKSNGSQELIPNSEWGWMDRNLGAVSNSMTQDDWNRSGGLLYQWGRKDPIPPLSWKGNDQYEVSGSVGRVRHRESVIKTGAIKIDDLIKRVPLSQATVSNNIRLSVKNPLSLIYVNKDDNSGLAYYNNNLNLPYNWFGQSSSLPKERLGELNLWSDNSQGTIRFPSGGAHNFYSNARPYRNKSPYDPCPNGWRIPSMIVANLGNLEYVDDVRLDYSPFGPKAYVGKNDFIRNKHNIIKPNDANVPAYMKGIKIYPTIGFDLTFFGGENFGMFPGTGQIHPWAHNGQYSDSHHVALWTATMTRHFDTTPSVVSRLLFMLPDKNQPDVPDPNFSEITGRYTYDPLFYEYTSGANGCRCVKDPLYLVNGYNFPTEFYSEIENYTEGLYNPNSYQIVKKATVSVVEIPVTKAFSAQNMLLENPQILYPSSYNNLKANVAWADNDSLVSKLTIENPSPASLSALSSSKIRVEILANQSGNAVITLHNGSVENPAYWSWHIWVTEGVIRTYNYLTENRNANATNYINYVKKGYILKTQFMDRNLGATTSFPISMFNPAKVSATEKLQIKKSTGFHYQWGRKDPIPIFISADRSSYDIYLGSTNDDGSVNYTALSKEEYNNMNGNYIVSFDDFSATENILSTDKTSEKIVKALRYSVKNPLVYMIPSAFSPYTAYNPDHSAGTDWIASEPGLAIDRWGRGGVKSPFDPCPEGWRIPDVVLSGFYDYQDLGVSPWHKKDMYDGRFYNIVTDYLGVTVKMPTAPEALGYFFKNSAYNLGGYPNAGSRGIRSVVANESPIGKFNSINFRDPGVWTASLNESRGRPISLKFNAVSHAMTAFNDNNDPYVGNSCRCVKITYDSNGREEGVVPRLPILIKGETAARESGFQEEITEIIREKKVILFPNPVDDVLYIDAVKGEEYEYQLYNVAGQLLKSGKFNQDLLDVSSLTKGVYIIRVNQSEKVFKIIKK